MSRQKYYRGKYLIGIYGPVSQGETLYALLDNQWEFAELMGITIFNAKTILNKLFNHKISFVRFYGKCCTVEFIDYSKS